MDRSLIEQRVNAVENTAGSIVGIAAWCTLHAAQASDIVGCIGERMCNSACSVDSRSALLLVLHEMVLSALSKGTTDVAKRAILSSICRTLPNVVKRMRTLADPGSSFGSTLNRVLSWWAMLRAFPDVWIGELKAPVLSGSGGDAGVADELRSVNRLLMNYKSARDAFDKLAGAEGAASSAIESAKEEAIQRLVTLQKAVDGRGGSSSSLASLLQSELVQLCGTRDESSTQNQTVELAVKVEDSGDILGSFF